MRKIIAGLLKHTAFFFFFFKCINKLNPLQDFYRVLHSSVSQVGVFSIVNNTWMQIAELSLCGRVLPSLYPPPHLL